MIGFNELKLELEQRPFVLKKFAPLLDRPELLAFGAGNAFHGLRATIDLPFSALMDDTPGYAGQSIGRLSIESTSLLTERTKENLCVVICANTTSAIARMSDKLRSYGLVYGEHFMDCALLHEVSISRRLKAQFNISTSDETFRVLHALSRNLVMPNLSTIAGSWLFVELIESLPGACDGHVAECGVYQGANALASLFTSPQLRSRSYELFDSFEGLRGFSENDPKSREGEFADADFQSLRETLAVFPHVQLRKGFFETTLPRLDRHEYAVVYVDCDLEHPTRFCCEFFWDKLQPGGFLLVHDYWFPDDKESIGSTNFRGVKRAVDGFFRASTDRCLVFPETSHAVFRKPLT
jgi:hypothetical protein